MGRLLSVQDEHTDAVGFSPHSSMILYAFLFFHSNSSPNHHIHVKINPNPSYLLEIRSNHGRTRRTQSALMTRKHKKEMNPYLPWWKSCWILGLDGWKLIKAWRLMEWVERRRNEGGWEGEERASFSWKMRRKIWSKALIKVGDSLNLIGWSLWLNFSQPSSIFMAICATNWGCVWLSNQP